MARPRKQPNDDVEEKEVTDPAPGPVEGEGTDEARRVDAETNAAMDEAQPYPSQKDLDEAKIRMMTGNGYQNRALKSQKSDD